MKADVLSPSLEAEKLSSAGQFSGPVRAHIHLAYGYGRENWARRFDSGQLVGTNERDPYGYYHAEAMGAILTSSVDHRENYLSKFVRLGLRAVLGFDFVHVWRNRSAIKAAEIIWTHTESQFLGVAFLYKVLGWRKKARPLLLAQSVWLIDHWHAQSGPRRWLWSHLVKEADVLTFHSLENKRVAERMFPFSRTELVKFGIRVVEKIKPKIQEKNLGFNIISVGNDKHRDWKVAIEAMSMLPNDKLTIVSATIDRKLLVGAHNVDCIAAKTNSQLRELYNQADLALVPLKANLHASGCTALQEAALVGLPIIATVTGGIESYFDDKSVRFAPLGDARSIADAVNDLRGRAELRQAMAERAQKRMGPDGLSSESFARRHVEISRELLSSSAMTT